MLFLCIFGLILLIFSLKVSGSVQKRKKKYGINDGTVVYSDIYQKEEPLLSKKFNLSGKPDYIVRSKRGAFIPVEVKTGSYETPLSNHIMQLMAYCLLLEETHGRSVPYGLLYYYDTGKRYSIPFDTVRRSELERTIQEMWQSLKTGEVEINHDDPKRCKHCSMRRFCHERLE